MKWEWNGRRLAPLHTIARRLLALPMLRAAQCLVFLANLVGCGFDEAMREWRNRGLL